MGTGTHEKARRKRRRGSDRQQPGPASQSYGLQVAQLAGVPRPVIERAREHLAQLEQQSLEQTNRPAGAQHQPFQSDLFASAAHPLVEHLQSLDVDDLTPRQALDLLYSMKREWA